MARRIALIGKSGAGKSAVSKLLSEKRNFNVIRTGEICRKISNILFGNEEKSSTQSLDDALTQIDESIFLRAALRSANLADDVVIDALRFHGDVALAKSLDFLTMRVSCDDSLRLDRLAARGQAYDPNREGIHRSETELDEHDCDFYLINDGTRTELSHEIDTIIGNMR